MPGSSEETGKEAPACPSRRVFVGLEMARWVCKHEDLSSDPQTPCKMKDVSVCL